MTQCKKFRGKGIPYRCYKEVRINQFGELGEGGWELLKLCSGEYCGPSISKIRAYGDEPQRCI